MFHRLTLTVCLLIALGGATGQTASAYKPTTEFQPGCLSVRQGINFYRTATWQWQDQLGFIRTQSNFITKEKPASCKYAYWVAKSWALRATYFHERYKREMSSSITKFWIDVAQCETGGVFGYPLWDWGKYRNRSRLEGSKFEGAVGFAATTWHAWAGEINLLGRFPHAFDAPMLMQIKVAQYGLTVHGDGWDCI